MAMSYGARYAPLYDLFYSDKPYDKEVTFVARQLSDHGVGHGARILELACGTGGHAIRLAKRGYDVIATDYSDAMIAEACRKARSQRVIVKFEQRDMRKLPVPVRPFDAALCLFDSIGYARTDAGTVAAIRGVHRSLRPGGLFLLEFWHAPAMLSGFDPVRVRRFRRGTKTFLRISETQLEGKRSLARVSYNVYELRKNGTYNHNHEVHLNRYFTVSEMERFAKASGFKPLAAYDGFRSGKVTEETWHVVSVWQKRALTAPEPKLGRTGGIYPPWTRFEQHCGWV
jgi:SAM-dependent methyltransferase